jgi:RimJ/RimL family protein N-acetyltransferase
VILAPRRDLGGALALLLPERPNPLLGFHVVQTGHGSCFVDRWPDPRAAIFESQGGAQLAGDTAAFEAVELRRLSGLIDAPRSFEPLLAEAFPELMVWDRVIFSLDASVRSPVPAAAEIRALVADDVLQIWALPPELAWIGRTDGDPLSFATSGHAMGAFVAGRLASIACVFFQGVSFQELGVITLEEFRGRGLNTACAAALCQQIQARGQSPSWSTSLDNAASIRVAQKLGFTEFGRGVMYITGPANAPPGARRP